ncbi:MAG: glycosyltransferase family 39 protein [Pirellulaceae bacterium]
MAVLLVLGTGLRLAFPSRMAVEHFDEGVYASNIWFGSESGFQYPMQRLYAPPLLPGLIEWSMIFDRLSGAREVNTWTPMVPSLLAGCVTLLLVWRMTREWFGSEAGIATLAIASLSDFHALYSRAALTESLLLLLFIAAVWTLKRAFSTNSYLALAVAGLLTGLGWWTKYNGWLPLAVGAGGLVVAFTLDADHRRQAGRLIAFWLGAAAIAFAVWSPHLRELQSYGGYAEVAANHRQYVVGLAGWASSLGQQYANLSFFDGWASCASVGVAMLFAGSMGPLDRHRLVRLLAVASGLGAANAWLGTALVMFVLSVGFVGAQLYRRRFAVHTEDARDDLALYFLAAWIAGLFIVTPLYHPYPRLTLPWLCAGWIGAGVAISRLIEQSPRTSKPWSAILVVSVLALSLGLHRVAEHGTPAWQSRTGWLPISKQIVEEVGDRAVATRGNRDEAFVIVFGEPGLFFQLNAAGTQAFGPAADLSFITRTPPDTSVPIFLVTGPHAERTAGFPEELARHAPRLERIAEYSYMPSDLVLLNQYHPRLLARGQAPMRAERVTLYEVVDKRE